MNDTINDLGNAVDGGERMHAARPEGQPDRPEGQPARPEGQPDRPEGQPARSEWQPARSGEQPARSEWQPARSGEQPERPPGEQSAWQSQLPQAQWPQQPQPQAHPPWPQQLPRPQSQPQLPQAMPWPYPPMAPSRPRARHGMKIVGGVFIALVLLLVFFSKTVYNYDLPRVTAQRPNSGRLDKVETSSGQAEWEATEKIYAPLTGDVAEVLVEEGDRVEAGQPLYRMSYDADVDSAERKLREIDNSEKKLVNDVENTKLSIEQAKRQIDSVERSIQAVDAEVAAIEENAAAAAAKADNDMAQLEMDILKAERSLADSEVLFEIGAGTARDVDTARESLDALELKRQAQELSAADTQRSYAKQADDVRAKVADYRKSIEDSRAQIETYELSLQSKDIDLAGYALQAEPYKQQLDDYEAHAVVASPTNGTVLSLGTEKGVRVNENAMVAEVGVEGSFVVFCSISIDNNFVGTGDPCQLENSTHTLAGSVQSITLAGASATGSGGATSKTVKIALDSDEVESGETFTITFEKMSQTSYTLVPNSALNVDNEGYYVYQVKRRKGILGDEYYIGRLGVYIGDSDGTNTAIVRGTMFFDPLVISSDKTISEGDVVLLENESDFLES